MKRIANSVLAMVALAMFSVTTRAAEKAGEGCIQPSPMDMVVMTVGKVGSQKVLLCEGGVWVSQGRVGTEEVQLLVTLEQVDRQDRVIKADISAFDGSVVSYGRFLQMPAVSKVTKSSATLELLPPILITGVSFMALPKVQHDGRIEADVAMDIGTMRVTETVKNNDSEQQIPDTVVRHVREKVVFESGLEQTLFAEGGYAVKIRANIGRTDG